MSFLRATFAAAIAVLIADSATAAPIVIDPNFDQTQTSSPYFYGINAWNANFAGQPTTTPGYNPSYAGTIGFDVLNQWNNGTPGNGETKVGFLANTGSYISQAISGFKFNELYQITVLANGRYPNPGDSSNAAASLQISTSASGAVYNGSIPAVDVPQAQGNKFMTVTTQSFTANADTLLVTLTNTGVSTSTVLLSGFAITDLGVSPTPFPVPEPISALLLGSGLAGLAVVRRRC